MKGQFRGVDIGWRQCATGYEHRFDGRLPDEKHLSSRGALEGARAPALKGLLGRALLSMARLEVSEYLFERAAHNVNIVWSDWRQLEVVVSCVL